MPSTSHIIEQPKPYHPIHIWAHEPVEEIWACCAYDHGAFCRLCQRVDGTLLALLESCQNGHLIAKATATGEMEFKVTQKGEAYIEQQVQTDPEMTQFWVDLQKQEQGE